MNQNAEKLDTCQLEQMLNGVNRSQVNPIVEELFRDFAERRTALSDAIENQEYETCRIQAHSLKALSQTFGFEGLTQLARKLEEASQARDGEDIVQIASGIFDLMGSSKEALRAYLEEKYSDNK
ncbi:Hpt domain-containing protein [Emcibacter sp.]|uniref:Hpt domain-containing protein n=1 Tax=Emcibacter sp. TaxID=1979954 RepID=UPI002AA82C5A|nr:Hpt domain-containing protein [Emcibacter sp.]